MESEGDTKKSDLKIIIIGDSAVGKSKLVERFLEKGYNEHQNSTYGVTIYSYKHLFDKGDSMNIEIWDTAGQERFSKLHPSYYHRADAALLVFDLTRKETYKNLENWYDELRENRESIPCLCTANKLEVVPNMSKKSFNFIKKHKMPFYFSSAADGTNVVRCFSDTIKAARVYQETCKDITDLIYKELETMSDEE